MLALYIMPELRVYLYIFHYKVENGYKVNISQLLTQHQSKCDVKYS